MTQEKFEGFPPEKSENSYEVLGLPRSATQEDIQKRGRELVTKLHPQAAGGGNEKEFKRISEALSNLKTPAKRAAYDKTLSPALKDLGSYFNSTFKPGPSDQSINDSLRAMREAFNKSKNPNTKDPKK